MSLSFERWLTQARGQETWKVAPPAVVISGSCRGERHSQCQGACLVERAIVFHPHTQDVQHDLSWAHVACQCTCHASA